MQSTSWEELQYKREETKNVMQNNGGETYEKFQKMY